MRREYPDAPIVAVSGIVIEQGSVLLVRRGQPPSAGAWSLPGGVLELGETLEQGLRRELREETGLLVEPIAPAAVIDHIERDEQGAVRFHYILVDYLCRVVGGTLRPASDAADACTRTLRDVEAGLVDGMTEKTAGVIRLANELMLLKQRNVSAL